MVELFLWCEGWDLNPHGCPHAPQTCASAYSATFAFGTLIFYHTKTDMSIVFLKKLE